MLAPRRELRDAVGVPVLAFLVFALMVFAIIDAIIRPQDQVKHLPKFAWILIVIALPLVGSVLWFTLGREWQTAPRETMSFGDPRRWSREQPATPPPSPGRDTRSTAQQLADLEREIEIAELEEQIRRRKAQPGESAG